MYHPGFWQGSHMQPCSMISELEEVFPGLVRRITARDRHTVVLPLYGRPLRRHRHSFIRLSSNVLPVWDRPCKSRSGRRLTVTSIYRDHRSRGQSVQRIVKSQRESRITLNHLQREAIGSCGSVMCKSTSPPRTSGQHVGCLRYDNQPQQHYSRRALAFLQRHYPYHQHRIRRRTMARPIFHLPHIPLILRIRQSFLPNRPRTRRLLL